MSIPMAHVVGVDPSVQQLEQHARNLQTRLEKEIEQMRDEFKSGIRAAEYASEEAQRRLNAAHDKKMRRADEEIKALRDELKLALAAVERAYAEAETRGAADWIAAHPEAAQPYEHLKRFKKDLEHEYKLMEEKLKTEAEKEREEIRMESYTRILKILAGMFVGGLLGASL